MNRLKERSFTVILLWTVGVLLFSWGCSRKNAENYNIQRVMGNNPAPPPEFEVCTVASRKVTRDVEGLGNLVFYDKAEVLSRIDGIVGEILVKKGDRVQKGQKLATISNYQLELDRIKVEK
ncbi:MAG: biotin/lipoyl-binding protein, partial [Spirochaetota bacterium]